MHNAIPNRDNGYWEPVGPGLGVPLGTAAVTGVQQAVALLASSNLQQVILQILHLQSAICRVSTAYWQSETHANHSWCLHSHTNVMVIVGIVASSHHESPHGHIHYIVITYSTNNTTIQSQMGHRAPPHMGHRAQYSKEQSTTTIAVAQIPHLYEHRAGTGTSTFEHTQCFMT